MSHVEARGLSRRFGDVVAVENLSFEVAAGEIVGLLGANGAGKTTTMRMLLGLLTPSAGSATIDGRPILSIDRRAMGYVPQGLGLYRELTVAENLRFVSAAFGVEMPALEDEGLANIADHRIGEVPLGLRRRVAFVAARCHQPGVLILDEPTSGVSPLGRARLWETIHATAESGAAILVSTHYMEEAEECDRVIMMASGRMVASGSVGEIVGRSTSVVITGDIRASIVAAIGEAGGTALVDPVGWRVVGLDVRQVRDITGPGVQVEIVPATFEETFVSLSS